MSQQRHICVCYHEPCADGGFGAFAAYLFFVSAKQLPSDVKLSFLPCRVELAAPSIDTSVTDVYLIDYTGSLSNVLSWANSATNVTLLDHHKTAIDALDTAELPNNVVNRCDLNHSGAMLAWNFFSSLIDDESLRASVFTPELHRIFEYVEDRDLWRHQLPDSKAVATAIANSNYNFNVLVNPGLWSELAAVNLESMRQAGIRQIVSLEAAIASELKDAFCIDMLGTKCYAVVTERKSLRSEIGNALAQKSLDDGLTAMGAVAYFESSLNNNSLIKVSLRSQGDVDTTLISSRFGGGGHANASSFNVRKQTFMSWI